MKIKPAVRLHGNIRVPGDKSISHRAAMVAALAKGQTLIENFSSSTDCVATLACLQRLGVDIERAGHSVTIIGEGPFALHEPSDSLDCGNSGTTMRLLAGILAGQDFASRLVGDASLSARPMARIIDPLERMGAKITPTDGHAPLEIQGREPLDAISYELPVASAQLKSCVLLAGLLAKGRTEVTETTATRDHTERMLRWFGIEVTTEPAESGYRISLEGPAHFSAQERLEIPGDISSAAFYLTAAAMLPGSDLRIESVGLNTTRTQILSILGDAGANLEISEQTVIANEPVGTIWITGKERRAVSTPNARTTVLDGPLIAQLIDELPMLAVMGTQLDGGLEIRDAAELRIKESDRIAATVNGLRAMGATVDELPDGLRVEGPVQLRGGACIDAHRDHRIAMAFAVAALWADGETEIDGADDCVAVSCPEFFELLDSVAER
jgi:3-phosphoshikimate 1-carboxyvinyltransferase